ncbi:MAG: ATP-binding protein [Clostridium sp.]|nr:ATP-binding protein [Clostridium sp.]
MNKKKLLSLIQQRENTKLDFKLKIDISSESGKKELAKDVCAIANSKGGRGYLIIGVEDRTKRLVGINRIKSLDEEKIQQVVSSRCEPPIPIKVEVLEIDGVDIGIITIFDGGQKPYQIKETGAFHIRRGSITDIMRKSELVAAFEENQLLTVETCKVVTSSAEFLNRELIEKYFKIKGITINKENESFLLESAGIAYLDKRSRKLRCTFGGLLVFCNNNNICIPNNAIRIINKINNNYSKSIMINGNLLDMIDKTEEEMYKLLPDNYPVYAVMEAVKNSIMYREYSIIDKLIEVIVTKTSIIIISPGQLVSKSDVVGEMSYNKRNMWIYDKLISLDEGRRFINDGNGLVRIKEAFKGKRKVRLINSILDDCFKVILPMSLE